MFKNERSEQELIERYNQLSLKNGNIDTMTMTEKVSLFYSWFTVLTHAQQVQVIINSIMSFDKHTQSVVVNGMSFNSYYIQKMFVILLPHFKKVINDHCLINMSIAPRAEAN